jgi:hypothetical protein
MAVLYKKPSSDCLVRRIVASAQLTAPNIWTNSKENSRNNGMVCFDVYRQHCKKSRTGDMLYQGLNRFCSYRVSLMQ